MEIIFLEPSLEPIFWEHVNRDLPHYFYFAFDWKYNSDVTKILLALEENHIDGMMLVYRQSIVQLRGSIEAVKELLKRLSLERVELQAEMQHEQYILEKFKPILSRKMILILLTKMRKNQRLNIWW